MPGCLVPTEIKCKNAMYDFTYTFLLVGQVTTAYLQGCYAGRIIGQCTWNLDILYNFFMKIKVILVHELMKVGVNK